MNYKSRLQRRKKKKWSATYINNAEYLLKMKELRRVPFNNAFGFRNPVPMQAWKESVKSNRVI